MKRSTALKIALNLFSVLSAMSYASCATAPPQAPVIPLEIRLTDIAVEMKSRDLIVISSRLEIDHLSAGNSMPLVAQFQVKVGNDEVKTFPGIPIAFSRNPVSIPFSAELDISRLRNPDEFPETSGEAEITLTARLISLKDESEQAVAMTSGSCLVIRDPILEVTKIRLSRDVLVTSNLFVTVRIDNPNSFPLEFGSILYRFHGEGRKWTTERAEKTVSVQGLSSELITLPVPLNFTTMGRDVFDLVAKLKHVIYKLEGETSIATGLSCLPAFPLAFDLTGATEVTQ